MGETGVSSCYLMVPHQDSNLELRIRNPTGWHTKHSVMIDLSFSPSKIVVDWVWVDEGFYYCTLLKPTDLICHC